MATRRGRTTPAKRPDFRNMYQKAKLIMNMDLNMHYDVRQRKQEKKHATRIKLLLDAGSLSVFQHHADNDFIIV